MCCGDSIVCVRLGGCFLRAVWYIYRLSSRALIICSVGRRGCVLSYVLLVCNRTRTHRQAQLGACVYAERVAAGVVLGAMVLACFVLGRRRMHTFAEQRSSFDLRSAEIEL